MKEGAVPALGLNATHGAEAWAAFVLEALSAESVLLASGARRVNVVGKRAHVPRILSDGNVAWVAELQEIPSDAPQGDDLILEPKKVANLVSLSNESIADAPVDELDQTGLALTRAVAAGVDAKAFSADAPSAVAPAGLRSLALPLAVGAVTIENITRAVGAIAATGGVADAVYVRPTDLTNLRLEKDTTGRPLLQPDQKVAGAESIAGARLWAVPTLPAGTAIIAQADQIVVGVRQDAEVSFSDSLALLGRRRAGPAWSPGSTST